jgi:hypothetical protein
MRTRPGQLDETEHHQGRDGDSRLVIDPRAKRQAQRLGQHRPTILAVEIYPDLTQSSADAVALLRHDMAP